MIIRQGYGIITDSWTGDVSLLGRATTDDGIRGLEKLRTNGFELFETLPQAKKAASGYQEVSGLPVSFALVSLALPQTRRDHSKLRNSDGIVALTSEKNHLWENPLIELYGPNLPHMGDAFDPNFTPIYSNNLTPYRASQFNIPTPYERASNTKRILRTDEIRSSVGRFRIRRAKAA